MNELQPFDNTELNLDNSLLQKEKQPFLKRYKIYFIIGAIILVIALVVVLCVCLIKGPNNGNKNKDKDKETPFEKESIKLEVNSNEDEKEIFFLSEEFKINRTNLRNLEENYILYVDGQKYPFTKSMKLKKGKHIIELLLNGTKLSC